MPIATGPASGQLLSDHEDAADLAQARREAVLLGLDWGTSSLRALLFDGDGQLIASRTRPWGIMCLPDSEAGPGAPPRAGFELAFEGICGDWLARWPGLPVLACGMVGSAQGWCDAGYAGLPSNPAALAHSLVPLRSGGGSTIHIVPGMIEHGSLPNVMRGEETQVFGVGAAHASGDCLVGLPGSHSKWVRTRNGQVLGFDSFMTGELFAALCGHTILGRTMQAGGAPDDQAFRRGVRTAGGSDGRLGLLSTIFSTRTLGLVGKLAASAQADYLSGLLIGHELAALAQCRAASLHGAQPVLVGSEELCRRYALAMSELGLPAPRRAAQATEQGLWRIAVAAGLVGTAPAA